MQQSPQEQQYSPQIPSSFQSNDEIDLRELFKALWGGKLIIIATTVLFAIAAVAVALNSQEWWSSKAKVGWAQAQDISAYRQQVKQFQPVFDIYQDDGTVLVSEELDELTDPEVLFGRFVSAFNSSDNKRRFLDSSEEFQQFKEKINAELSGEALIKARRTLYSEWFDKIVAKEENSKNKRTPYNISFQSTTSESSYLLLVNYIKAIKAKVHQDALSNLKAIVSAKKNELVQQKRILEVQAKNSLLVEADKSRYALSIAQAAGITSPIQSHDSREIFDINMGSKALAAKLDVLSSIKNLSVIEPRLQQVNAKLEMLDNLKVNRSIQFQTFRFLEDVEQPITRDKPKRTLIVILGTLLGGMLGVAIVLIRFAFRRELD
ncbi:Wzz/FepE/Etk N-terminal domain-containing protein [Vibrio sp. SCSIO 43145]|uniref:LPS O-antigen chain length determinant protein WzzB n=1 Tax=Vibrio sp. SCSIO 43145 TaxID=2819097 RepID=UPI002075A464|nr:Wzz/FepE/Etk N-terminal domain-containing protein [Vibrio sp. SCSIO 43145]USD33984.1 LPS chain length-determining protein [Vibrio sp. SCSIO 43186]USD47054.1 LPS chain length-determining protein [Vibrio sp. SCSIO 43145]USD71108.1 LPS chain length-determining protein [Vibrio sp. SCSIO 43139]